MLRTLPLLLLLAGLAHADKVILFAGGTNPAENVGATDAALKGPFGIDQDRAGNYFLVEYGGHRVCKIDSKGVLSTFAGTGEKGAADGPAAKATFNAPHNLVVGLDGSLYVADTLNHRVRKIDPKGTVTTMAGTGKASFGGDGGPADKAGFNETYCVALDPAGKNLYVADLGNRRVRVIDLATNMVKTVAGNGMKGVPKDGSDAVTSPLVDPRAVAVDGKGNLWILERSGHALRVVDSKGKVRTVAGTGTAGDKGIDGPALMAQLRSPKFLIADRDGNIVIADSDNHRIVMYVPAEEKLVLVAGTGKAGKEGVGGKALEVQLNQPHGVFQDRDGRLYIVDSSNNRILRIEP
jgi:YVTN family beta-propeller protein